MRTNNENKNNKRMEVPQPKSTAVKIDYAG